MPRSILPLAALLLCSTALAGCQTMSSLNPFGGGEAVSDKAVLEKQIAMAPAADIAGGVRQAHELRLAGKYDDASRILSQLMLVASDDPRVVGEYGKTLLQRGRAQDAVQFLSRAVQLQSGDWTTYSALGVSYDQLGDQTSAKDAYEHALALNPREPSVLSNYALSRMLASDTNGARSLAARAQAAGGAVDPKIARNIAMIEDTAPQVPVAMMPRPIPQFASAAPAPLAPAPVAKIATVAPAPQSVAKVATVTPVSAPQPVAKVASVTAAPVVQAKVALPPAPQPVNAQVAASGAPRILMPATTNNTLPAGTQPFSGVVMQPVPADPQAGPVKLKPPVRSQSAIALVKVTPSHFAANVPHEAQKPVADKLAAAKPAKPVVEKTAAATPAKPLAPVAQPVAGKASVKLADKMPVPVKTAAVTVAVKADAVAAAKPVADKTPAPVKAVAVKQDGVPALRLAADASTP